MKRKLVALMLFAMVPAVSIAADAPATKAPAKPAATKVDPAQRSARSPERTRIFATLSCRRRARASPTASTAG